MAELPLFLLDANVFIEAAKRYYAFDIAPEFWNALLREAQNDRIRSIDKVKDEIERGHDELNDWVKRNFYLYFVSTADQIVLEKYQEIISWAIQQPFTEQAQKELAEIGNADAWLVACAQTKGYVLVTEEKYNPMIQTKIPIPNICKQFRVPFIDTFAMLRYLKIQL